MAGPCAQPNSACYTYATAWLSIAPCLPRERHQIANLDRPILETKHENSLDPLLIRAHSRRAKPSIRAALKAISASLSILLRRLGSIDEANWTVSLGSPNGWRLQGRQN